MLPMIARYFSVMMSLCYRQVTHPVVQMLIRSDNSNSAGVDHDEEQCLQCSASTSESAACIFKLVQCTTVARILPAISYRAEHLKLNISHFRSPAS